MSNDKQDKPGKPDDKIVIHVDHTKFDANKPVMTGRELRTLAGVAENRTLWREVPGGDDLVDDTEPVTLKNGMHFYTVAKTVNPG